MHYWRQDNFEGLVRLAEEADVCGYGGFAEYCRLREGGLRKEAFDVLSRFIGEMRGSKATRRREFVDWLLCYVDQNARLYDALPAPLRKEIVAPTIAEWIKDEPGNAKALRWSEDTEEMRAAAEAIPPDEVAIGNYTRRILDGVEYATHELPSGYLGESLDDDLADVQRVLELLDRVAGARFFHPLRENALGLKMQIQKEIDRRR